MSDTPKPPEWLDDIAKALFVRLAPELGDMTEGRRETLAAYCDVASKFREASAELAAEGVTVRNSTGIGKKTNPAFTAYKQLADTLAKFSRVLDLTAEVDAEPDDDFSEWQTETEEDGNG